MQEFGHLLHYLKACNFKSSEDLIGTLINFILHLPFSSP